MSNQEQYSKIVDWLYKNDGQFSSKNEWREKFLEFLKEVLGLEGGVPNSFKGINKQTARSKNILENCYKEEINNRLKTAPYPWNKIKIETNEDYNSKELKKLIDLSLNIRKLIENW